MPKKSEKPVTQGQFAKAMKKMDAKIDERFEKIDERFEKNDKRMGTFATKDDLWKAINGVEERLSKRIDEMEEKMYTKDDHNRLMSWIDESMAELRDTRQERQLSGHQMLRLDDKVADHEKRLRLLEKSAA